MPLSDDTLNPGPAHRNDSPAPTSGGGGPVFPRPGGDLPEGPVQFRVRVEGLVQGVGFRPYIHRLAASFGLAGAVSNDPGGVQIAVEGRREDLEAFVKAIPAHAPPLSIVESVRCGESPAEGMEGFHIQSSAAAGPADTLVSPDVGACDDCLREIRDPANRRHRYPFTNCTNCGPRYTIIRGLPYDRASTTMSVFPMCDACRAEYNDPADRRFHAQPNACPACGPRLWLADALGGPAQSGDPVREAARRLERGEIVAVKGVGGFHLAVDAGDEAAVRRLRERKSREEKPLAVMAADLAAARRLARVAPDEETLLASPQRPIVLLEKKACGGGAENPLLAPSVAPGNRFVGIMLPYAPLHDLLLRETSLPALVMTSGNFSEEPIIIENDEAVGRLSQTADAFLLHDRDILARVDDSVCRSFRGRIFFLRRARGYAPSPVRLPVDVPPSLAVGADLKSAICLGRGGRAFLSPHIGDLERTSVSDSFDFTAEHMSDLFGIRPELVAHDLHPDYESTRKALAWFGGVRKTAVQHHHAHAASCLADNGLRGPAIALAMDGAGYGEDGKIWGGEVLVAGLASFQRRFHLRYAPMPGGDRASREPWRMAAAHLYGAFGDEFHRLPLPLWGLVPETSVTVVREMLEKGVNCPETSSMGRLFDAMAAISGLRAVSTFEGQAAMELEMAADDDIGGAYPFPLDGGVVETSPAVRAAALDVLGGATPAAVSARFHRGLVRLFLEVSLRLREESGIDAVALTGGVFQNLVLLQKSVEALENEGFRVLTHRQVPCNDGGVALGQLVSAASREAACGP